MSDLSASTLLVMLAALLLLSALFSGAEAAMMATNRYRLRHNATVKKQRGAKIALGLLEKTDRLTGLVLLFKTLINAAAAVVCAHVLLRLIGHPEWTLEISIVSITFLLLVFSEITPKLLGVTYADPLAPFLSYFLAPLLRLSAPLLWLTRLFVRALQHKGHFSPKFSAKEQTLSPAELRTLVLEPTHFILPKQRSILNNLFGLDAVTVEDVMTPRSTIKILDLSQDWDAVVAQLLSSQHSRLPVCRESLDILLGVLPIRRVIGELQRDELSESSLIGQLQEPYYIPAGTQALVQLTFFRENRQRLGFVIDEYGEILGLLTLEDIIEEIIGQFTTSLPDHSTAVTWDSEGCALVDGTKSLREINRRLDLYFPTDGPKTLNGLILEYFQDIPETGVSFKIAGIQIEILQTQDRSVRTAKLFRP